MNIGKKITKKISEKVSKKVKNTDTYNTERIVDPDMLYNAVTGGNAPDTQSNNTVMFADNAIARTDEFEVDEMLAHLLRQYHSTEQNSTEQDGAEQLTTEEQKQLHGLFHRIASISDIEPRLYEHCADNPNSIANWLPPLVRAHAEHAETTSTPNPLHIPRTQVMRLDKALAQFTRVEYADTNDMSKQAFNAYLESALDLPDDAFIKTGTFSGKFQFANCHCTEPDEMGEYFQVITNYAQVIGAGESVDIAVRDYIENHDPQDLTIYGGMPLRCEYRIFVDFGHSDDATLTAMDAQHTAPMTRTTMEHAFTPENTEHNSTEHIADPRLLGVTHYWHPRVMRAHFARVEDDNNYASFAATQTVNEMRRDMHAFAQFTPRMHTLFDTHVGPVTDAVRALLPHMQRAGFRGAWSIDVMCNVEADGEITYHLIDMALACESALIDELYTVEELRFAPLHEIIEATSGEIMAYPTAPAFMEGKHVDGHGVTHTLVQGSATDALRAGVDAGVIPTDGSAVPTVVSIDADGTRHVTATGVSEVSASAPEVSVPEVSAPEQPKQLPNEDS